jgi:hypothetical protein
VGILVKSGLSVAVNVLVGVEVRVDCPSGRAVEVNQV